jgi:hypothetical protein
MNSRTLNGYHPVVLPNTPRGIPRVDDRRVLVVFLGVDEALQTSGRKRVSNSPLPGDHDPERFNPAI